MSILIALIIGAVVGWLAAVVMGRNEGIVGSIAIGIGGALLGEILSSLVSGNAQSFFDLSWMGIFWTFIGALLCSMALNALQARRSSSI